MHISAIFQFFIFSNNKGWLAQCIYNWLIDWISSAFCSGWVVPGTYSCCDEETGWSKENYNGHRVKRIWKHFAKHWELDFGRFVILLPYGVISSCVHGNTGKTCLSRYIGSSPFNAKIVSTKDSHFEKYFSITLGWFAYLRFLCLILWKIRLSWSMRKWQ